MLFIRLHFVGLWATWSSSCIFQRDVRKQTHEETCYRNWLTVMEAEKNHDLPSARGGIQSEPQSPRTGAARCQAWSVGRPGGQSTDVRGQEKWTSQLKWRDFPPPLSFVLFSPSKDWTRSTDTDVSSIPVLIFSGNTLTKPPSPYWPSGHPLAQTI